MTYTEPGGGEYLVCEQFRGNQVLPAPDLEFLQITPLQLFAE
jgi:hypothetical protein